MCLAAHIKAGCAAARDIIQGGRLSCPVQTSGFGASAFELPLWEATGSPHRRPTVRLIRGRRRLRTRPSPNFKGIMWRKIQHLTKSFLNEVKLIQHLNTLSLAEKGEVGLRGGDNPANRPNGSQFDGHRPKGHRPSNLRHSSGLSDSRKINGNQTNGTHTNGHKANGTQSNDTHANGSHTNGTRTNGTHTNGTHTNGTHTNGTHANGTRTNGHHHSGISGYGKLSNAIHYTFNDGARIDDEIEELADLVLLPGQAHPRHIEYAKQAAIPGLKRGKKQAALARVVFQYQVNKKLVKALAVLARERERVEDLLEMNIDALGNLGIPVAGRQRDESTQTDFTVLPRAGENVLGGNGISKAQPSIIGGWFSRLLKRKSLPGDDGDAPRPRGGHIESHESAQLMLRGGGTDAEGEDVPEQASRERTPLPSEAPSTKSAESTSKPATSPLDTSRPLMPLEPEVSSSTSADSTVTPSKPLHAYSPKRPSKLRFSFTGEEASAQTKEAANSEVPEVDQGGKKDMASVAEDTHEERVFQQHERPRAPDAIKQPKLRKVISNKKLITKIAAGQAEANAQGYVVTQESVMRSRKYLGSHGMVGALKAAWDEMVAENDDAISAPEDDHFEMSKRKVSDPKGNQAESRLGQASPGGTMASGSGQQQGPLESMDDDNPAARLVEEVIASAVPRSLPPVSSEIVTGALADQTESSSAHGGGQDTDALVGEMMRCLKTVTAAMNDAEQSTDQRDAPVNNPDPDADDMPHDQPKPHLPTLGKSKVPCLKLVIPTPQDVPSKNRDRDSKSPSEMLDDELSGLSKIMEAPDDANSPDDSTAQKDGPGDANPADNSGVKRDSRHDTDSPDDSRAKRVKFVDGTKEHDGGSTERFPVIPAGEPTEGLVDESAVEPSLRGGEQPSGTSRNERRVSFAPGTKSGSARGQSPPCHVALRRGNVTHGRDTFGDGNPGNGSDAEGLAMLMVRTHRVVCNAMLGCKLLGIPVTQESVVRMLMGRPDEEKILEESKDLRTLPEELPSQPEMSKEDAKAAKALADSDMWRWTGEGSHKRSKKFICVRPTQPSHERLAYLRRKLKERKRQAREDRDEIEALVQKKMVCAFPAIEDKPLEDSLPRKDQDTAAKMVLAPFLRRPQTASEYASEASDVSTVVPGKHRGPGSTRTNVGDKSRLETLNPLNGKSPEGDMVPQTHVCGQICLDAPVSYAMSKEQAAEIRAGRRHTPEEKGTVVTAPIIAKNGHETVVQFANRPSPNGARESG